MYDQNSNRILSQIRLKRRHAAGDRQCMWRVAAGEAELWMMLQNLDRLREIDSAYPDFASQKIIGSPRDCLWVA